MFKKYLKGKLKDIGSLFKSKPKIVKKDSSQKLITKKNNPIVKKSNTNVKTKSTDVVKTRPKSVNKNKKNNNLRNIGIGTGVAIAGTAANKMFSDDSSSSVRKNNNPGTGNEIIGKKKKKDFGMGSVDNLSKSKVKQGPPKPPKKAPIKKKKSKSNISNSSSYDADFTKKGLEKRGLSPKASMSKSNMAKTTSAKDKKNASGQDFGGKKKKKTAPMYESKGTNGAVKNPFDIKLTNNLSKKKQKERLKPSGPVPKYKSMGGKLKMAKGYSAGGKIFTGR